MPFTSVVFVVEGWPWGELICKASEFFKDLSIGVSVFTLTALSGDRFFAIVDPLRKFHSHSGRRATRITIGIAVLIWILAGVMGIPSMKASHVQVSLYRSLLSVTWYSQMVSLFRICQHLTTWQLKFAIPSPRNGAQITQKSSFSSDLHASMPFPFS